MNTQLAREALLKISAGIAELALSIGADDPPVARAGVPRGVPTASAVSAAGGSPPPAAPSFDELPPDDEYTPAVAAVEQVTQRIAVADQQDAALGKCPVHGVPWTVKAGGTSKAGKPYKAFWKCAEKTGDAFCDQKPTKVWQDTHPIREAA